MDEDEPLLDIIYICPVCNHEWHEFWSCACDSICDECGAKDIGAYTWTDV